MNTTITVNGLGGSRFLSVLGTQLTGQHLHGALAPLIDGRVESLELDAQLAAQVAEVVERLLAEQPRDEEPPLLFSPNVGDNVAIVRDGLFEVQTPSRRAPRIWRFVPRGTRGRVIAHEGETDRVMLEPSREVAYVRPRSMTGTRFWTPR